MTTRRRGAAHRRAGSRSAWHAALAGVVLLVLLLAGRAASPLAAQTPAAADGPCQAQRQAIAVSQGRERQTEILGTADDPNGADAIRTAQLQALSSCFDQVIVPDVTAAETNCDRAAAAALEALGFLKQVDLLGFRDELDAQYNWTDAAIIVIHINCYNEAYNKCVDKHDLTQARVMLSEHRAVLLLLKAGAADPIDATKVEKCLTFELDFDSSISDHPAPLKETYISHVQAKVPLHSSADGANREGSASLQYLSSTVEGDSSRGLCPPVLSQLTGSTFRVNGLALNFDPTVAPVDPVGSAVIDLGMPMALYNQNCGRASTLNLDAIVNGLSCLHSSELAPPGPGYCDNRDASFREQYRYIIRGWSYVWNVDAPEVYARKTYAQSRSIQYGDPGNPITETFTEKTTIELRHTPQR